MSSRHRSSCIKHVPEFNTIDLTLTLSESEELINSSLGSGLDLKDRIVEKAQGL